MIHLLIVSMVSHLTTLFSARLDARASRISGHIIFKNLSLGPSNACFLVIAIITKASIVLSLPMVVSIFPGTLSLMNKFFHSQTFIQMLVLNFVPSSDFYPTFSSTLHPCSGVHKHMIIVLILLYLLMLHKIRLEICYMQEKIQAETVVIQAQTTLISCAPAREAAQSSELICLHRQRWQTPD